MLWKLFCVNHFSHLAKNKDISINVSDKEGKVVIMNKNTFNEKIKLLLIYEKINEHKIIPKTQKFNKEITKLVNNLF